MYATDFSVSLGLFYRPVLPEIETIYAESEDNLLWFSRLVRSSGSRFLVVLFPVRIQLESHDWDLFRNAYALESERYDLEYPNRRLVSFFRRHNIDYVDVLPAFKTALRRDPSAHLYRARGDMHFGEYGQRIAAQVIGDAVIALGD